MEKNKAFTLVELLAVIVILGIIALIAVPIVTNIIENSKEKANDYGLELFLKAFNNGIYEERLNDINFNPESCEVNNGIVTCDGVQLDIDTSNVNGKILLQDREITYYGLNVGSSYYSIGHTDEKCFKYTTSGDSVTITKYYNNIDNDSTKAECPRDVIIPSTIDGKYVTIIGNNAFRGMELTSVIIPNSVMIIRGVAFNRNKLTSITIPNSVTRIDGYAFSANDISEASLPSSLTEISVGLFSNNKLTEITIPNSVTSIGNKAFEENFFRSIVIPDSVTSIGDSAFNLNNLTNVAIGSGIINIGPNAFYNLSTETNGPNQITSMIIDTHQSDVTVGTDAFSGVTGTVCWLKDSDCGNN